MLEAWDSPLGEDGISGKFEDVAAMVGNFVNNFLEIRVYDLDRDKVER